MPNNHKLVNTIVTSIFGIIMGILTIFNPTLTINKFGFGYPYNVYLGVMFIINQLLY